MEKVRKTMEGCSKEEKACNINMGTSLDNFNACLGKFFGDGNGIPLQYSCLENPMDRGAWQATVHGVAKSQSQLSTQHTCLSSDIMGWVWNCGPASSASLGSLLEMQIPGFTPDLLAQKLWGGPRRLWFHNLPGEADAQGSLRTTGLMF